MQTAYSPKVVKILAIAAVFGTLVLAILSGLLLKKYATSFRFTVGWAVAAALFSLSAIPFFLTGLRNFKAGLTRAYVILCVGIGIFGIAQLQIPAITLFHWEGWLNSGGAVAVYFVSTVPILLGVRQFARLLAIKTMWTSVMLCVGLSVILAISAAFLPHVKVSTAEAPYHVLLGIVVWNMLFVTFAGVLSVKIRQVVSIVYMKPMTWLAAAMFELAAAGAHFFVVHLLLTDGDWYFDYSFSVVPFAIGGLLLLKAGYEFNKINFNLGEVKAVGEAGTGFRKLIIVSSLDVVVYTASLASDRRRIDPMLDDVRLLTASLAPGQALSDANQAVLTSVYRKLEEYLTKQEPLRVFTQDGLRENIIQKFGKDNLRTVTFLQ